MPHPLYAAIRDDDWMRAKEIIDQDRASVPNSAISPTYKRALHVAALFGKVTIVDELLKYPGISVDICDAFGNTPLSIATITGNTQIAKLLLNKDPQILGLPHHTRYLATKAFWEEKKQKGHQERDRYELHATMAFQNGHQEMGRYLYSATPWETVRKYRVPCFPQLLRCCLQTQCFDVVLDLLRRDLLLLSASSGEIMSEELVEGYEHEEPWRPIYGIATMNSAIPSPSELVYWKRRIYNCIKKPSAADIYHVRVPIQQEDESKRAQARKGIDKIRELKLLHAQADKILGLVCDYAKKANHVNLLAVSLLLAAKEGNVDFVQKVSNANPEILLIGNPSYQNLFHHAVKHRQASVFNTIRGLRFKEAIAASTDIDGNTLLHVAATQAPDIVLNRMDGPALQMQSELQWFKEVEDLLPRTYREARNKDGMTAKELFKESHKELMKQAEKWMRATASSCSVVGALIVTVVFAAGFTVPGGNDQNFGYPLFIKQPFFKAFVFSNTLSLISSSTSVLMFLAILTSRYSEEKFLNSLPTKLVVGLSSLFISLVTMIVAFLSAIRLMLKHTNYSWGLIPIIILASIPIVLFVLSQFPLFLHSVLSTSSSIFNRKVKLWP